MVGGFRMTAVMRDADSCRRAAAAAIRIRVREWQLGGCVTDHWAGETHVCAYAPGRVGDLVLPALCNQRSATRAARRSVTLSTCKERVKQCLGGYALVGGVIAQ